MVEFLSQNGESHAPQLSPAVNGTVYALRYPEFLEPQCPKTDSNLSKNHSVLTPNPGSFREDAKSQVRLDQRPKQSH